MAGPSSRTLFQQSMARCLAQDDFTHRFYDRFLASSEEVREKFRYTDFAAQRKRFARSLAVAADAVAGEPKALSEISERAKSHDRRHLNIRPELYELWLDALIATAQECDPDFSESIEDSWRVVLGHVIRHMTRAY